MKLLQLDLEKTGDTKEYFSVDNNINSQGTYTTIQKSRQK